MRKVLKFKKLSKMSHPEAKIVDRLVAMSYRFSQKHRAIFRQAHHNLQSLIKRKKELELMANEKV